MNGWSSAIAEFHFLRPAWLLALVALPLLGLLWKRLQAGRDPWRRAVDAHLLAALRAPATRVADRGPLALSLLIVLLATLALAGPAWQRLPQPLLRAEAALVIALDLSERMRATDVAPTRLERARFKIADLLRERRDGQIALIAYAGDAFTVAPLTDDANTLQSLLGALEPDTLPEPGQRADRAIAEARRLLRSAGFASGDVLLITDQASDADRRAAASAQAEGLRVSVLGIGSESGAPIALRGGGFLRDASGDIVLPRRDDDALRKLADAGGGAYAVLSVDSADLRSLGLLDAAPAAALRDDDATSAQFRDEGAWLLLLLLPLVALLFRRGWLACLPLTCVLLPQPAAALDWNALWQRDDQRAWQALQADQAEAARALAQDPQLRASAAYREGDYAAAAADFAQSDNADAHYNRGNALARAGRLQEAVDAYDAALARSPGMDDAVANRAAVIEAMKQAEQQSQDGSQQRSEQPQGGDSEQSPQQEGEPQDESQSEQSDSQQQEGQQRQDTGQSDTDDDGSEQPPDAQGEDSAEQQAEDFADEMARALAEQAEQGEDEAPPNALPQPTPEQTEAMEQQQALEQLLRRVPDDPGGLLRRKFAIEARRRQLEGRENEP